MVVYTLVRLIEVIATWITSLYFEIHETKRDSFFSPYIDVPFAGSLTGSKNPIFVLKKILTRVVCCFMIDQVFNLNG